MKLPLVTDIQKYSIHDGDGIRTTVFFKGCPLSCVWCHNPETQSYMPQLLFEEDRCTGCGNCAAVCPQKAVTVRDGRAVTDEEHCRRCGICLDDCLQNIRHLSGRQYTVEELVREVEKDRAFYERSGGGVTFSGGEVLAQNPDYLERLFQELYTKGYRINVDTCGHAPFTVMERLLPYVNVFLYDIKMMDGALHKRYTGENNELILHNLIRLSRKGAYLWIRIPVIGGVNNTAENMEQTAMFLKREEIAVRQIHLLPYHNTGKGKYKRLNREYEGAAFYSPNKEELETFQSVFQKYGFNQIMIGG